MSEIIKNRYEFVLFFDVENVNQGNETDSGNMPRIDLETGRGVVTDVSLKRKIRNFVENARLDQNGFGIYVHDGLQINMGQEKENNGLKVKAESRKLPKDAEEAKLLADTICKNYFDVRAFGAVLSMEVKNGIVRGPVQLNVARSIDPVVLQEIQVPRVAVGSSNGNGKNAVREEARKYILPYALYRLEGYIAANLAEQTGFSNADLELFWEALMNMFEQDRFSAKSKMIARKLIIFEHESAMGNAPAHKLFNLVRIDKKDVNNPNREFKDYAVSVDEEVLPAGVRVKERER